MADKKYQVFISSTYADLKEERQLVTRAILDMGHIPAGMEMFPASDVEQLGYIKKVIDECDYYVLILGARYGSLDQDGISFTEREFDYAVEKGKTVLVFVHAKMDDIPRGKTDRDEKKYEMLQNFKEKATTDRLVKFWESSPELAAQAVLALTFATSSHPQVGWIRANQIPSHSTVTDVLRYREEIDRLEEELATVRAENTPRFDDAADLSQEVVIHYDSQTVDGWWSSEQAMTYLDFLRLVAPKLHAPGRLAGAEGGVKSGLSDRFAVPGLVQPKRADIQDALLHLVAAGYVTMRPGSPVEGTIYQLSELGTKTWQEISYTKA